VDAGFLRHIRCRAVILVGLITISPVVTGCDGQSRTVEVKPRENSRKEWLMRRANARQKATPSSKSRPAIPSSKRYGQ
jgi:hypothetical protein